MAESVQTLLDDTIARYQSTNSSSSGVTKERLYANPNRGQPGTDRQIAGGNGAAGAGLTPVPQDDKDRTLTDGTIWMLVRSRWGSEGSIVIDGKKYKHSDIASAVMKAESGAKTHAVSPTGCCHGIWQINLQAHPTVSLRCAQSSICATDAAKRIWKAAKAAGGTGWEPWEAFTTGAYKKFLGDVTIQDANTDTVGIGAGSTSGADCGILPEVACNFFKGLGILFDGAFWVRVLKIIAGALLLGIGIYMIAKSYLPPIPPIIPV